MRKLVKDLRRRRWSHLSIANLRILLGFAFLPAGLKKVLYEPFTDSANTGTFHDFLDAFYATGFFYSFVGAVQLLIAALLMTQTFATLGALMTLPVITCILVFCWSTGVVPTAVVVTLMFLGTLALVLWDVERWRAVVRPENAPPPVESSAHRPAEDNRPPIDLSLWRACGAAILVFYGISCLLHGGVYRPKGLDLGEPAFYALVMLPLFPLTTLLVEERRRARTGPMTAS